ncbi:MAG: glycine C-acetyltransferase [Bacteroidia bacterium]|nr:glycine C-acetyltransferase [Bacteroidia bacterium]MDW8333224.1 glycine C-acetyltransferase [Bacteroidia bacterium]
MGGYEKVRAQLARELDETRAAGLYKTERLIAGPQGVEIVLSDGRKVLNFCANNYLGLSSHPRVVAAAKEAMDRYGYGMSSVRFICGTQDQHKRLEETTARFVGAEDCILYAACFDANGGVFEPLLGPEDAVISDALNHASIIDGVRLCKAKRYLYAHNDLDELETRLKEAQGARRILVVTDGCFSMDGTIARLDEICDLADRYGAMTMVDECHATGFLGKTGRGTIEYRNVIGRVDIVTGTYGKALGGALGGFTAARKEIVEILRQRSRPYLFSNSLPPAVVGATLEVFKILEQSTELRDKLERNTQYFRRRMTDEGFDVKPGEHPIVPVMLYDAPLAQRFADALLDEGVYAVGFFYPVVPKGQARIRLQMSAAHEIEHLERAVQAFVRVREKLGVGIQSHVR